MLFSWIPLWINLINSIKSQSNSNVILNTSDASTVHQCKCIVLQYTCGCRDIPFCHYAFSFLNQMLKFCVSSRIIWKWIIMMNWCKMVLYAIMIQTWFPWSDHSAFKLRFWSGQLLPDSELINQNCTLDVKGASIGSKYVEGKGEPLRLFGFPLSAYNCIFFF